MNAPALTATAVPASALVSAADERSGFDLYRDELLHSWLRILTTLGGTLVPLFIVLDYFTMPPELLRRFAAYRLVTTGLVVVQHLWIRRTRPGPYSYIHGYIFTILVGGMIVRMTTDLGGFNSSYYAGLNLVIVAACVLLPWRTLHSAINGLLAVGMYVLANLSIPVSTAASVVNNLYFMGATVVISVAICHTKHQLIFQEYRLREQILGTNRDLERSRAELKQARDALWGEMEVAKRIQTALLPQNRRLGGYQAAAVMLPAAEVGGDYYDFIETDAGEHWVAIGDVSGHGVEAGLVMMMTQTSLLSLVGTRTGMAPSDVFRAVNASLRENISRLGAHRYMTLNLIRLWPDKLTVSGKHQDIFVYRRAEKRVDQISNQGIWVGVLPDAKGCSPDMDIPLSPGDVVFLFTDGLTEAMDSDGQMFGQDRLAAAFREAAELPLEEGLHQLLSQVTRFAARQDDDLTLVLLRKDEQQS